MGYILYVEILINNTVQVSFWRLLVIHANSLSLRGLPSSFKGAHGKIHYRLSGKLSRSKRAASKAEAKFTFVARADYDHSTLMVWSQLDQKNIQSLILMHEIQNRHMWTNNNNINNK